MITLQKFERLISAPLAQKAVSFTYFYATGEGLDNWAMTLYAKPRHEQYSELKTALGEVLVSNMKDTERLVLMDKLFVVVERTVGQLHADYIYENQSLSQDQQISVYEVRSLYFLMIVVYRNIALRHQNIARVKPNDGNWITKLLPIKKSELDSEENILTLSIHQMMSLYVKLLLEYALLYQKVPPIVWQEINSWYTKAMSVNIHRITVDTIDKHYPDMSIHDQYMQACGASFGNFFAYRRQDILNAYKVLPAWSKFFKTTFETNPAFRVFVNLQGSEPPELITPYASVNPYSSSARCLFFDLSDFVAHMKQVSSGEHVDGTAQSLFEVRFAKMILLAFEQRTMQEMQGSGYERPSEILVGFASIFNEVTGGQDLSSIIRERALSSEFHVKISSSVIGISHPKEAVGVTYKNETAVRFRFRKEDEGADDEELLPSCPLLHVYGLFALKSPQSTNKNPWRLGVAHWVQKEDGAIQVDGRFLGRVLMAVGIRLSKFDSRNREFVHGLLIEGDGLYEQSTLIIPRYHFKAGDYVVLRIDTKEMELRLERNILTTDEIEQYQIVRLNEMGQI